MLFPFAVRRRTIQRALVGVQLLWKMTEFLAALVASLRERLGTPAMRAQTRTRMRMCPVANQIGARPSQDQWSPPVMGDIVLNRRKLEAAISSRAKIDLSATGRSWKKASCNGWGQHGAKSWFWERTILTVFKRSTKTGKVSGFERIAHFFILRFSSYVLSPRLFSTLYSFF